MYMELLIKEELVKARYQYQPNHTHLLCSLKSDTHTRNRYGRPPSKAKRLDWSRGLPSSQGDLPITKGTVTWSWARARCILIRHMRRWVSSAFFTPRLPSRVFR